MTMTEPTSAQKEAGNYTKDHVRVHGLDVSIENRKGSQRSGTGRDGKPWSVKMPASYGYIKGTVGHDGDHVDCYLGPHVKAPNVYVINQVDADTKKFDEHKCMIGFASKKQAIDTYRKGFSDGRGGARIGTVSELPMHVFKQTLEKYTGRKERAAGGRVEEFAEGGPPAFDPDAYLQTPFDPDAYLKTETPPSGFLAKAGSLAKSAVEPITSYPETYMKMQREARDEMGRGVEQLTNPSGAWDVAKGVGNVGLGALGYLASPINAGLRTVVGKPIEDITGVPKEYTEFAGGLALPGIGLTRLPKAPVPRPPPAPPSIAGTTLSEGQATGELSLIQREQAALRGVPSMGTGAHEHAANFAAQQVAQTGRAHENVARALDPYGAIVAETPIEAGRVASEGFRSAERSTKAGVTSAYDYAKSLPGEVSGGAFEGIAPQIKNRLSMLPDNPIIVDELTPRAQKALGYIDNVVGQMRIPNKASLSKDSRLGELQAGEDVGVTLRGIDQWRKNLTAMRGDAIANAGTNATDARAMRAIVGAFDDHVEAAVRSPAFRGDPRVVQAWLDARAAHADYKSTFGKQGGRDPVGNVVQKVIGDRVNDPAIPSDVANHLFGASGVAPNSLNVGVARRFREVLGAQSPEWSAVKQGLWARLTEMPTGDPRGHKGIADRITTFLANPEAANAVYTPWQQNLMREYADLQRHLVVPQAGANWSNTASGNVFQKISGTVGMLVGGFLGHTAGAKMGLPFPVGEAVGAAMAKVPQKLDQAREAMRVASQMPVLANQAQAYAKAYAKVQHAPTPFSERVARTTAIQLDHTLRKFGISLDQVTPLQGPIPGRAEENRPQ